MAAALFALAGALIGVLGTVLTELVRGHRDDRKFQQEALRAACVDLATEVTRLQDISHELRKTPGDVQLQSTAQEVHSRAHAVQERLRLTSRSVATQEAGRWLMHCVYYQWRSTQGGPGEFWQARDGAREWLTKLHVEARKEWAWEAHRFIRILQRVFPSPEVNGVTRHLSHFPVGAAVVRTQSEPLAPAPNCGTYRLGGRFTEGVSLRVPRLAAICDVRE
jgi:hypothetical protein